MLRFVVAYDIIQHDIHGIWMAFTITILLLYEIILLTNMAKVWSAWLTEGGF